MKTITTDVLIAGAGPAGLSLAMELGARGISAELIEPQVDVNAHPRASLLGQRSMEFFRRHGIDGQILAAGLPTHLPYEIRFVRALIGPALHKWAVTPYDELRKMHRGEIPATPESKVSPYTRVQIGQHTIEPILRRRVAQFADTVTTRYGWLLESFVQDADGILATVRCTATQEQIEIKAQYLAACDGAHSPVRNALGIGHSGRGAIGRNRSFLIQAPRLIEEAGFERANLHFVYKKGVYGVLTDLDGRGLYSYSHFSPGYTGADEDPRDVLQAAAGKAFEFEVLRTMEWFHHQSVADRMQSGRVFLLGDAAHRFCPSGGIGMNTAIADAFDLGWKLQAKLRGWGGQSLLDSYERERWPVAVRNTTNAASNRDRLDATLNGLPSAIDDAGAEGEAARAFATLRFKWLGQQFGSTGAHLGMRYKDSPVVVPDGTPEPPDDTRMVVPSTWPGSRAPHAFLDDGTSTLDWFDGTGFVLVRGGGDEGEAQPMLDAAAGMGIPLRVQNADGEVAALYERAWVLVRPDGHVAWRGNTLPADPSAVLSLVTGR